MNNYQELNYRRYNAILEKIEQLQEANKDLNEWKSAFKDTQDYPECFDEEGVHQIQYNLAEALTKRKRALAKFKKFVTLQLSVENLDELKEELQVVKSQPEYFDISDLMESLTAVADAKKAFLKARNEFLAV